MGKLKVLLANIGKFIWKYKFTILCMAFFYITCRALYSNHNNQYIFLSLSFFFLLNALSKTSKVLKWIFTILFTFLITIDAYFAYILGESLSFGVLDAILNTNPGEVYGASSTILIYGIPIFLGILFLFTLVQRELKGTRIGKKMSYCIFGVYWVVVLPIYSVSQTKKKHTDEEFKKAPAYLTTLMAGKVPLIFRNVVMYLAYREQIKSVESYKNVERLMPNDVTLNDSVAAPLKIYVVIGESAVSHHLSLYDYDVPTTPFLDSLSNVNPNLQHYDAISCAPLTSIALMRILTLATVLDDAPIYEQKNILELAKLGGYETLWISNQGMLGLTDSYIGTFVSVSDYYFYLQKYPPNDINIVPWIIPKLEKDKKQLFVLHLEGSHMEYSHRFDEIDAEAIKGSGSVVDYDRTIHHTDRFFRELYSVIEEDGSPYVLIYFSDHGEIIGKGHGFVKDRVAQFQIPFITMQSGGFSIDSLVNKYTNKEINNINNISVINIVSELVGYQFSEEEVQKVVDASKYIKHADQNVYLYEDLKEKYGE